MNPLAHAEELRCACGSLLARLLSGDLELRCRRCKRRIVLKPPADPRRAALPSAWTCQCEEDRSAPG